MIANNRFFEFKLYRNRDFDANRFDYRLPWNLLEAIPGEKLSNREFDSNRFHNRLALEMLEAIPGQKLSNHEFDSSSIRGKSIFGI